MKRPHEEKFTRKLGDPVHRRLLLRPDGHLEMEDGSDPAEYLKQYRRFRGLKGKVYVNLVPSDTLEALEQDVVSFRRWSS